MAVIGLCLFGAAGPLLAQSLILPLRVAPTAPIVDEQGQLLEGDFHQPGDLVHILSAPEGIFPPLADGSPDPRNPVIEGGVTAIGKLTDPNAGPSGLFGAAISEKRPKNGSKLFVRVYNAPTVAEATFYADSQLFSVSRNKLFNANIGACDKAIYTGDDDQDGLVDSWEIALGSDRGNRDTDGDGMLDGEEHKAGTDVLDADSVLAVRSLRKVEGVKAAGALSIVWHTVPGKTYQVEYTADNLSGAPEFEPIGDPVTAETTETEIIITDGLQGSRGNYRIRLVE